MAHVLLGFTGSVATIKAVQVFTAIRAAVPGAEVKVIVTSHASQFLDVSLQDTQGDEAELMKKCIHTDEMEWQWRCRGDPVLHIELRRWADILVIAPLDANTLAKAVNGLCDNLLTCVVRAWEVGVKPIVVAPAMNTAMWEHPLTDQQLMQFRALFGKCRGDPPPQSSATFAVVIPPVAKTLACGDVGQGALASVDDIARIVAETLTHSNPSLQ